MSVAMIVRHLPTLSYLDPESDYSNLYVSQFFKMYYYYYSDNIKLA